MEEGAELLAMKVPSDGPSACKCVYTVCVSDRFVCVCVCVCVCVWVGGWVGGCACVCAHTHACCHVGTIILYHNIIEVEPYLISCHTNPLSFHFHAF